MKLSDLPKEVIDDLCQEDDWRLDIDPGFDAKHEFWMAWRHFIILPEERLSYYEATEADLADFLTFNGFEVLLPVPRSHHPRIELIRLIPGEGHQSLTLFLHDSFHESWFSDSWGARYGFLAVADRYQKFGCDFYLASYYHFSYLIGTDYETAREVMLQRKHDS
ncbi:hypothetical protein J5X98_21960 [Leptothermofonsia sichuanensis E412]|uniref:hypothetical protein n=1 Tax=Leptothermofonsia sichuanensis TaxID=2917832 RepID=UPI001CA69DB6|nr:hypothetical protein [Leptothermofonsia sichuanensis]QZZ19933.1 hypothetical protein J5X98_21960 [Leptothermofonsia sichuanensis E412]